MLLSTFLLSQLGTIGAGSSFFVLCCVLLSTIPFLFDGLMSLISLVQQNVLQAVGTERHERPREQEDSFQVEGGQLRTTQSVAYVLPEAVLRNPELADRLTSNWKDSAFLNSNRIQISGFFIIVLQMLLGTGLMSETGGMLTGGATLLYACSSLMGYLGFGASPFFKFSRINIIPLALLALGLGSLGIGNLALSMNLILLMMVNLYDANCAANNERTA